MNCKSCGVVIEWAGINTTYIDAEQSPFCGNTSKKHEPASPVAQPENGEIMPYANWKEGDSVPAPVGKYAPPTPVHMPPRGVTTGTHKTKGDNYSMPVPNGDGMESAGQEVVSEPLQPVVTRSGVAQSGAVVQYSDASGIDKAAMALAIETGLSYYFFRAKLGEFISEPPSPSRQAAAPAQEAHTPKNLYQIFKHKKDCTWITPLATGEGHWGCNCGLDSLLIGLEDFELATSTGAPPSDEQFWQFMEENAEIVKRWPGWKRIAAGLNAASPTGGAEPLESRVEYFNRFGVMAPDYDELRCHEKPEVHANLHSTPVKSTPNASAEPAAAEPSAWPSDLPANGMGAMNLLTTFWTGDLKGLTKEGARIVDSLVAHVTRGLREQLEQYTANKKIGDCIDCGKSIWFREAHMDEGKGKFHPICRVIKQRESAEAQLATAREALREEISIKTDGPCQLGVLNFCRCKDCIRKRSLAALAPAKEQL